MVARAFIPGSEMIKIQFQFNFTFDYCSNYHIHCCHTMEQDFVQPARNSVLSTAEDGAGGFAGLEGK